MSLATRAYWVVRPGHGELREEQLSESLAADSSIVRTECSGISVGTERLVGLGLVPPECESTMACRSMAGSFALPVKYGYSLVGTGVRGRLAGRRCFVMHPHQELAVVTDNEVVELPEGIPAVRATLLPNLETALNGLWDAELASGERTLVIGAGLVGTLVAFVVHATTGERAVIVEADPARRALAESRPWVASALAPGQVEPASVAVAFHCSGTPHGLRLALAALAFEGRVVELSWYGARPVTIELGTHFHSRRLRILASQVGAVAPSHRASLGRAGRTAAVLRLLADSVLDSVPERPVAFDRAPELFADLYRGAPGLLAPTLAY